MVEHHRAREGPESGVHHGHRPPIHRCPGVPARPPGHHARSGRRPGLPRRLRPLVALFALVLPSPVHAIDPNRTLSQLVYRNWQMEDGLPQSSVNAIVQDRSGFLWVGTFGGLARFDGFDFEEIPLEVQGMSPGQRILDLLCSREGRLWAGTERGFLLADRDGMFSIEGAVGGEGSAALREGARGAIWFATSRAIFRWWKGRLEAFGPPLPESTGNVLDILPEPGGTVLLAASRGLFRITSTAVERLPGVAPDSTVQCLIRTRGGEVLFGTMHGVHRLDERGYAKHLAADFHVTSILEDRQGTLWIGSFQRGLWRYSRGKLEHCPRASGLATGHVKSLFEDDEGDLWIGTARTGLHEIVEGAVVPFGGPGSPLDHSITAVAGTAEHLWAALGCDGLARLDGDEITILPTRTPGGSRNICVQSMLPEPDGSLVLGGWTPALYRFRNGRMSRISHLPAEAGVTRALLRTGDGRLLAGTGAGIFTIEEGQARLLEGTSTVKVYCMVRSGGDRILAGTDQGVLELRNGLPPRTLVPARPLGGFPVRALLEDREGLLWIGTYGGGLFLRTGGRLAALSEAAGLPGRIVSAIVEDSSGRLWLTGNNGVTRVARKDLLEVAAGRRKRVFSRLYTARDGLPSTECNGGGSLPAWLDREGRLWVPTMRGLARIDTKVRSTAARPRPHIGTVLLDGRPVPPARLEEIPPTASSLEIHYTAIWLQNPGDLVFRYRLEGHDPGWREAGSRRAAYYGKLPPGTYRFRLQARVFGGPWVEAGSGLPIHRVPAFTEGPAYPVFVALASAGLVALLLLLRLHRVRRLRERLEAAVRKGIAERDRMDAMLRRINEGQHLREVLSFLYESFRDMIPCDRICYAVIEEDVVRAVWVRSRNPNTPLTVGVEAPLEGTELARLAREGDVRIIHDLEEHLRQRPGSPFTRLLVEEGLRSSLSVPLRAFGKAVGFLFFDSRQPHAYGNEHARLLKSIAAHLSLIIEKTRLLDELGAANATLAAQAVTDPLTGLANRRFLTRHLETEWLRMRRSRRPLAVLFCDIDMFKAYNDRYGHDRGDTCLRKVAEIIASFARRPGDLAARWGGEEFVLVLSGTHRKPAVAIAERLRREIEAAGIPHEDSPVAPVVTVSVGVAARVPGKDESHDDLLRAADEALYRAKKAGRNRVEPAPDPRD